MNPYREYTDKLGFIHLYKNPQGPSDNARLYTAQAYMLDILNKEFLFNDQERILNYGSVDFGLFDKYPGLNKLNSHDNQIGYLSTAKILRKKSMIRGVYTYGEMFGYCYNNLKPGKFDIKAQRQGNFVAFCKMCYHKIPNLWLLLWFYGAITVSIYKWKKRKETSTAILSKMMLIVLDKWHTKLFEKLFDWLVDFKKVVNIYYPKNHPLIAAWEKYIMRKNDNI